MTKPLAIDATLPASEAVACQSPPDTAQIHLALLHDLENSLLASRQALLDRDLARLEQLTCAQVSLLRELSRLDRQIFLPHSRRDPLSEVVAAACARVLSLARLHGALVARAQQSLRMLSNLVAGTGACYSPFADSMRRHLGEARTQPTSGKEA